MNSCLRVGILIKQIEPYTLFFFNQNATRYCVQIGPHLDLWSSVFVHFPKFAHFWTGNEEFVQGTFGFDFAIFEYDNMVGAAEERATM